MAQWHIGQSEPVQQRLLTLETLAKRLISQVVTQRANQTGKAMCAASATRWWSKWEVVNQVCHYFGYVEFFLRVIEDLAPALRAHLLEIFEN